MINTKIPTTIEPIVVENVPMSERVKEPKIDGPLALKDAPVGQLLENYEKEEQKPYIVSCLDLNIPYYSAEEGETRENLERIDGFIKEQMEDSNYKLSTETYKKVFERIKKGLGIEEEATQENVLERVAGFVKAFNRIKTMEEKDKRKGVLKQLYKLAKDKDYDTDTLALFLQEEYAKWLSINQ